MKLEQKYILDEDTFYRLNKVLRKVFYENYEGKAKFPKEVVQELREIWCKVDIIYHDQTLRSFSVGDVIYYPEQGIGHRFKIVGKDERNFQLTRITPMPKAESGITWLKDFEVDHYRLQRFWQKYK